MALSEPSMPLRRSVGRHTASHLTGLPDPLTGRSWSRDEDQLRGEGGNVRGTAIHIAARIADPAEPGQVYASWATRELLAGSPIGFY